ncbi:Palmitoyltransferase akr1 [Nosema bombycis CQ1]|uniref:Palmitoyltransferase n=1 Tax=Nosema bombycis (strain CQ1 / CVCC 102059) TaxID=578461 RepID=R0M992_NOSB1|nr:Palmitoyltransferase akr1 [Nosema bombycis CQ1]|eukprot:EOB14539.1 Palmitoyltransferase akr1 [Nosema bombycis CQ1]
MFLCMIFFKRSRLIFSCLLLILYFITKSPLISFIFNIVFTFYSYCIMFDSILENSVVYINIGMHLISFMYIQIIKTPYLEISKIKDSKSLIADMVLADHYNEENFCITCLNNNISRARHCDFCNKCVSGYIYHCPLLNKCITTNNIGSFVYYFFLSLIIYILTFTASYLNTPLYEFIICQFLLYGSFKMFNESKKKLEEQNIKETISYSDAQATPYVSIPIDEIQK